MQRSRGKVRVDVYLEGNAARAFVQLAHTTASRTDIVSEAVLLLAAREGIDCTKELDDEHGMA